MDNEVDNNFILLRKKLDILGFSQPLPISAYALVSAILDDLVKTTDSLKRSKQEISQLLEEKQAWELETEPYRCDNAKLLAGNNLLHLETLRLKENHESEIIELNQKIRNLELDKKLLEEHCTVLGYKLSGSDPKTAKNLQNGRNMNKKPFVSTVKSGSTFPKISGIFKSVEDKLSNCTCSMSKSDNVLFEIQRLQNDTKTQSELLESYRKQLDARDREIQRLCDLFTGGRPTSALGKECCYRNVGTLAEDVEYLQKEKNSMQLQLKDSIHNQHEAMQRAVKLADKNKLLEKELEELEKVALLVEKEANANLVEKERTNSELQLKLAKSRERIIELENEMRLFKISSDKDYAKVNLQAAINVTNDEKCRLIKQINSLTSKEKEYKMKIENLSKKNAKLKNKLSLIEFNKSKDIVSSMAAREDANLQSLSEKLVKMQLERDYYQKEFQKCFEKVNNNEKLNEMRKNEGVETESGSARNKIDEAELLTSKSVQTTISKMDRERNGLLCEVDRLKTERDSLRERIESSIQLQKGEQERHEKRIDSLMNKVMELESERRHLESSKVPNDITVKLLTEEIADQKKEISRLQDENCSLKSNFTQLRILHSHTEKSLEDAQSRLLLSERQLGQVESKLLTVDSARDTFRSERMSLEKDILKLKKFNMDLEVEKRNLIGQLDKKVERLDELEKEVKLFKQKNNDYNKEISHLHMKLRESAMEVKDKENSSHQSARDLDTNRKQLNQLKKTNDNLLAENHRLTNELADSGAQQLLLEKKLHESNMQIDDLKNQLRRYVIEVEKAEKLLMEKEYERTEMLDNFRSLSHDALDLEGQNQNLQQEANQVRRLLAESEMKHATQIEDMRLRERQLEGLLSEQIKTLTQQLAELHNELHTANENKLKMGLDLQAIEELCNKLDVQKDKLSEELGEALKIQKQLEVENDKLRDILLQMKTNEIGPVNRLQTELQSSEHEIETQRQTNRSLYDETIDLKQKVNLLQDEIHTIRIEQEKSDRLASEYRIQVQELKNKLIDERFNQVKSHEDNDKFSSKIKNVGSFFKNCDCDNLISNHMDTSKEFKRYIQGTIDLQQFKPIPFSSAFNKIRPLTDMFKDVASQTSSVDNLNSKIIAGLDHKSVTEAPKSSVITPLSVIRRKGKRSVNYSKCFTSKKHTNSIAICSNPLEANDEDSSDIDEDIRVLITKYFPEHRSRLSNMKVTPTNHLTEQLRVTSNNILLLNTSLNIVSSKKDINENKIKMINEEQCSASEIASTCSTDEHSDNQSIDSIHDIFLNTTFTIDDNNKAKVSENTYDIDSNHSNCKNSIVSDEGADNNRHPVTHNHSVYNSQNLISIPFSTPRTENFTISQIPTIKSVPDICNKAYNINMETNNLSGENNDNELCQDKLPDRHKLESKSTMLHKEIKQLLQSKKSFKKSQSMTFLNTHERVTAINHNYKYLDNNCRPEFLLSENKSEYYEPVSSDCDEIYQKYIQRLSKFVENSGGDLINNYSESESITLKDPAVGKQLKHVGDTPSYNFDTLFLEPSPDFPNHEPNNN